MNTALDTASPADSLDLMVFDLSRHSHLPSYLQYLIESWCAHDLGGRLSIVVWHTFLRDHGDVVELARRAPRGNIRFHTLSKGERKKKAALETEASGMAIAFPELLRAGREGGYAAFYDWELLSRHAEQLKARHSLVVHLDHYLPLLATGISAPTPVSGIYFGPTFHYGALAPGEPVTHDVQAQWLRQKFVLARALRHRQLHTLFFLDPFAEKEARRFANGEKGVYLADPVRLDPASPEQVTTLRAELGIGPGRRVFLLFGHLTRRKGIHQLLQALHQLSPQLCQQTCLLLAGTINPAYQVQLEAELNALRIRRPVQVVEQYSYVPQTDLPATYGLADVVLAPYPRHAGMSGVLLLAAAAGKPVLCSAFGLMGEIARGYGLGLTVDATQPAEIAAGLARFILEPPETLCDAAGMQRLADEHRAERFGATILSQVRRNTPGSP